MVITEEVVKLIIGQFGKDVMFFLLEKQGVDIVTTEEGVKLATRGQEEEEAFKPIEKYYVSSSEEKHLFNQFCKAAKDGEQNLIQELLTQGVKPDLRNTQNLSPLWIAVFYGRLGVVKLLLDTKMVDVNLKSVSGRTSIFWAAANGYEDIVKVLLQEGADVSLASKNGQTPLSMAKNSKIKKMLAGE
jgi:ankyrin repeat protein